MPANSQLWKARYSAEKLPAWPCPWRCGGVLSHEQIALNEETPPSRDARTDPNWEPDWLENHRVDQLRCGSCRGCAVLFSSTAHELEQVFDNDGYTWEEAVALRPRWLSPMPRIVEVPTTCPQYVAAALDEAFSLLWTSPAGALARLRVAVELVLDDQKVKRRARKKKPAGTRKTHPLNLHDRIEVFKREHKEHEDLGNFLLAAKWLGNEGAHANAELDDVLVAADLIEAVLVEVYDQRSKNLRAVAAAIHRRKGSLRRKKRGR